MKIKSSCKGATLSQRMQNHGPQRHKPNTRSVSAAPAELLILVSPVYPGFHFGLCPHFTLGYEKVSCLKALIMRLNFDVVAMLRTQAKHNYIHSIPILTPHSDNAPNEEKAIPPKNPTIMHRKIIVFTSIDREKP